MDAGLEIRPLTEDDAPAWRESAKLIFHALREAIGQRRLGGRIISMTGFTDPRRR